MDAWRIRSWLKKGPRCTCGCSERIPWSAVRLDAYKWHARGWRPHMPTERRPKGRCSYHDYYNDDENEERYIPFTLEEFKAYLVERRNVLHGIIYALQKHCMNMHEEWMCALLSYGHANSIWRSGRFNAETRSMLFELVGKNWFAAANKVLAWPNVASKIIEEDMMYLVKRPYRCGYEFMDQELSAAQRNWFLYHPALVEQTNKARTHKHWMCVLLWTGFVKTGMRAWKNARTPLPVPCKENVPLFVARIASNEFRLCPGTPFYQEALNWVTFLAMDSPGTLHKVLPKMGYKTQWLADVIDAVAPTGRVGRMSDSLRIFGRYGDPRVQVEKIWQWANDPAFATPRIAKALLYMATYILPWAKQNNQEKGLVRRLFEGEAIVRTIEHNAIWLSNKLPDKTLLDITRKRRRCQAVVAALRNTPRFQSLQRIVALRATVYLTLFFRKHVTLTQARAATRGDCPICWAPKILQPLHGDKRHGMCYSCKREMERKNMLDRCPMCRVSLRNTVLFDSEMSWIY